MLKMMTSSTFSSCLTPGCYNQWTNIGNAGLYPLILDPTITGMTVTNVLIDGGVGLNIMFLETLRKMGLHLARLITPTGVLSME
jgi:hypothetical protein